MSRKLLLFVFFFTIFCPRFFAYAGFEINEVMYDLKSGSDDGREWIEVYNNSDTPADFSAFRLFEADTNHKLKLVQGSATIEAHDYALIVSNPTKFKTDWFTPPSSGGASFSGTIFDSSFSLNNSGEMLMIKDKDLNVIDQFVYSSSMGGAGDGNSLQKINGVWQGAKSTPGEENKIEIKIPVAPVLPVVKPEVVQKKQNEIASKKLITTPNPLLNKEGAKASPPLRGENGLPAQAGRGGRSVFVIIFAFLLVLSTVTVYFIRKNRSPKVPGNDFEILE